MTSLSLFLFGVRHTSSSHEETRLTNVATPSEVSKASDEKDKLIKKRGSFGRRSAGAGSGIVGQMPAEHVQISQLFKRVRVFVKSNPVSLSSSTSDDEDPVPVKPARENLKKRRPSGDVETLAENFRDKCQCLDVDDDE